MRLDTAERFHRNRKRERDYGSWESPSRALLSVSSKSFATGTEVGGSGRGIADTAAAGGLHPKRGTPCPICMLLSIDAALYAGRAGVRSPPNHSPAHPTPHVCMRFCARECMCAGGGTEYTDRRGRGGAHRGLHRGSTNR